MGACTQLVLVACLYRAKPVTEPEGEVAWQDDYNAKPVTDTLNTWRAERA